VSNLPIEKRLLHYFLAMGAEPGEKAKIPQDNLGFIFGSEKAHVIILRNEDLLQGNKILEALLSLTSLRTASQLLYLAAPRILGASLDVTNFKPYGIGLLLFDDRRIDEAVAAQPLQRIEAPQQVSRGSDPDVLTELASLRTMYLEMEKTIATLREDLEMVRHRPESHIEPAEPSSPTRMARHEAVLTNPNASGSQLPSYFTNNPWLEVLSKRGRMGDEIIAG
jgi:hypothetical protein